MVCLLNSIHSKIGIFIFDQKVQECGAEVEDRSRRWTTSYCIIIITIMIIITVYESGNDVRLGNGPCTNKSNHRNTAGTPLLTVIRIKMAKCSRDFHRFITAQPRYLSLHTYPHSMFSQLGIDLNVACNTALFPQTGTLSPFVECQKPSDSWPSSHPHSPCLAASIQKLRAHLGEIMIKQVRSLPKCHFAHGLCEMRSYGIQCHGFIVY